MLTKTTVRVIKDAIPLVQKRGIEVVKQMYKILFKNHPKYMNTFNMSHHIKDDAPQVTALASKLLAVMENIEDLDPLYEDLMYIAEVHVSRNIQSTDYGPVGAALLESLVKTLKIEEGGKVYNQFAIFYNYVANQLILLEKQLYSQRENRLAGWSGFREFYVIDRVQESDSVVSLKLSNRDEAVLPKTSPGQFISIHNERLGITRQYSLINSPDSHFFEIAVKQVSSVYGDGVFSSYVHNDAKVGDTLKVTMPAAGFDLNRLPQRIIVVSAGIGITPHLSLFRYLKHHNIKPTITHINCVRDCSLEHFGAELQSLYGALDIDHHTIFTGSSERRIVFKQITDALPLRDDVGYFVCGPHSFMSNIHSLLDTTGVPDSNVHYDFFGPITPFKPKDSIEVDGRTVGLDEFLPSVAV